MIYTAKLNIIWQYSTYLVLSNDALQGLIVGGVIGVGSSIASTFAISWIRRPRISINENTTEVEMKYKQLDSDQVAII